MNGKSARGGTCLRRLQSEQRSLHVSSYPHLRVGSMACPVAKTASFSASALSFPTSPLLGGVMGATVVITRVIAMGGGLRSPCHEH